MEFQTSECLTLFDLRDAESNFPSNYSASDADLSSFLNPRRGQRWGDVLPNDDEVQNSVDLKRQCRFLVKMLNEGKEKRRGRKTKRRRKQPDEVEQAYRRIMGSFVKILPKPHVESGIVNLRTHPNEWLCILCGGRFTDFNLFKLHHDSNKQPRCSPSLMSE